MLHVTDLHVHVAPYHLMRPEARRTFLSGKADRDRIEGYSSDGEALLRVMDDQAIDRIGVINYISPTIIGPGVEVNDWALAFAAADPRRLLVFGRSTRSTPRTRAATSNGWRARGSVH